MNLKKVFLDINEIYIPELIACLETNRIGIGGELNVCPDCEEVFEAEEDYWSWE